MIHQPIKLSESLSLYSGDVITLNHSEPLLVEVIDYETNSIKLRRIDKSEYLYKSRLSFKSLSFSDKFEKGLIFVVENNDNDEINLKSSDKYLDLNSNKFSLSDKEKWLTITKQENISNIVDYEEKVDKENFNLHKNQAKKIIDEKRIIDCKSYDNKLDESLEYNFELSKEIHKEHNLTWSETITLGADIKLSIAMLAGLDLGGKLERTISSSNSIIKSETENITNSLKINCVPWKETKVKLEVRNIRILTPYTAKVKRVISGRNYKYLIEGELTTDNYSESRCRTETNSIRNILLVGWTGSGKSTLAKVLSGDDKFESSDGSVSKTRSFKKSDEFEYEGNHYCIIDNIGFDDTKLDEKEVLLEIGQAINSAREGLSHVLLVFDGKFSDRVKEDFDKLTALKITNSYVSLVRSKFVNFGTRNECEADRKQLERESPEINRLIDRCQGLLYINNNEDDERSCNKSRKRILDHLYKNCKSDPFKPKEWDNINVLIENYLSDKKMLELEVKTEENKRQIDNLKIDTAKKVKEKIQEEEIKEFVGLIEVGNK